MPTFNRILLDINALDDAHPAVTLALDLAGRCQARLKIVDVVPELQRQREHHLPTHLEADVVAHRRERLEQLAAEARSMGTVVEIDVLRGKPALAVIGEVLRSGHDLVMRAHGRAHTPPGPFGPVDQQLLRKCPVPVWLIGPDAKRPRQVVACVDASADDPVEQRLNAQIVTLARAIAGLEGGTVTLLHAWWVFGEELLRCHMREAELSEAVEAVRHAAADGLQALDDGLAEPMPGTKRELVRGRPENAIPEFVEAHHVDLVVMGTVARTGIAGFVMGNTAERILQRLRTSVIALKPEGFVSPVQLDAPS
ncbi:MAG: hypothetical protein GEU99_25085 [Luteitalea sp.]|nr:hypothetical protein [Luteitalea sp.]